TQASDLGLAALTTGALACVYGACTEERPRRRGLYWLAAYFLAGLGMLYKLPMPVVCVGLPAEGFGLGARRGGPLASLVAVRVGGGEARDLGRAALTTGALACVYGACTEERPRRRGLYWLAAYFLAGLGMLYKLPMPVVCVGLPAVVFVLVTRQWRLLASWWH